MSEAPVVCLIGTGAGGICGGINLRSRLGFTNFVILEKTSRGFGGEGGQAPVGFVLPRLALTQTNHFLFPTKGTWRHQ